MKTRRHSNTGFSLIEIMIVVVIVGVLTLVAVPAYQSFTVKANRAEAKSYLMHLAQRQQLYFNDSRTYAADEVVLGSPAPRRVSEDGRAEVGDNYCLKSDDCPGFFVVEVGPPPTFTITAIPRPITLQEKENDGKLSIDNTGEKLRTRIVNGVTVVEAW